MIIKCPECGFERQVNADKIPARSKMATCPKCKTKFQFRDLPDEFDFEPEEMPEPTVSKRPDLRSGTETPPSAPSKQAAPRQPEEPLDAPRNTDLLPGLEEPDTDKSEELWDRLGGMTPPDQNGHEEAPSYEDAPLPDWARKQEEEMYRQARAKMGFKDDIYDDDDSDRVTVKPPFEDLEHFGFFPGFFQTLKRICFAPRMFFERMPLGEGLGRPLVFALLILVLHDVFQTAYQLVGIVPPPTIDGEMLQIHSISMGAQLGITLLFSPVIWAIFLFIIAGIHHAILVALRSADGGFEATFRGVTYSVIPLLTGIIPQVNPIMGQILYVVVSSWSMVLVIIAWQALHKTSFLKAGLAAIMPAVIFMLIYFLSLGAVPTV